MAQRFQERVNGSSAKRQFELEPLEQRCLLSGGVAAVAASPLISHTLLVAAETQTDSTRPAQEINACDPAAGVGSILPSGSPTPTAQTASAQATSTGSTDAVAQGKEGTSQSVTASSAETQTGPGSQSANITISSGQSQVDGSPATEQLTQTLTAANGPPSAQATLGQGNSPAILNLAAFSQGPNDTTTIHLGGAAGPGVSPDGYDQLNVEGLAHLDGTLQIQLSNGFVPQPGQKFKVFTWGSRSGQFANWLGTAGIPGHPDYYFLPIYNAHDLTLEVIDDPNISPGASTAIQNGLNTLSQIGTLLNNVGSFAQNIPLIGDKLSSFIDSGSAISHVIAQQIQTLLSGGPTAEAAVTSFIQGWDGTNVAGFQIKVDGVLGHYDATGTGPFWWDMTLEITPAAISKTLQSVLGGALGAVFGSAPSVQVNGKLTVNMSFGYDSVFFVKLDHMTAEADVSVSGLNGFPFQLSPPGGPVSMNVTNGSVTLAASITATPDASILTANATTGARIEMATLTSMAASSTATSNAFNLAKTSSLNASFTLNGNITFGGISLTGTTMVQIQSSDLFSGAAPAVTVVVDSSLTVMGQTLTGTFTFKQTATETDLEATGVTLNLMVGAQRVLQATGSGEFALVGSGLAGTLSLTLTQGPNIPGLTLTGTTLNLALNTSSTAVATVDGNAVNLPAGPYYRVSGHATLGLSTPSANLTADFDFEPNGSNEVDVGIANLSFYFDNGTSNLLSLTNGSGAFVILAAGVYGTAGATVNLTVPGVTLEGTFNVLMNTTGSSQTAKSVTVNGTALNIPALLAGPYLQVQATGATPGTHAQLTVLGIPMMGDFLFENKTTNASHKVVTVAAANVSFGLGTVTNNLVSISNGSAAFIISANGVAGQGTVTVGVSAPGVTLSGTFGVAVNQTNGAVNETVTIGGSPVTVNLPAGPYLQVSGTGITLGFLGITVTGDFSFEQKTTTTNTQLVTVVANNVGFNFGTSLITATGGSGFFVLNDSGIVGQGSITINIGAFGGFSHTFNWAFNSTDPALDQTVTVDGIQHVLNQVDGPFNQLSLGSPVTLSITAGGQTQSIGVTGLVLTLDSAHNDVLVGVSGLSTTVGTSGVTLHVGGGTGAFVINSSGVAGLVNIDSTTVTLGGVAAGVALTATHLQLQFNNTGADVAPVSVPVDNNPADNVTVQFTGAYYHNYLSVSGAASFGLTFGPITINVGGNFAFETPGAGQFKVGATDLLFDLKLGSGPSAFTVASFNHGSGAFLINASGLAGSISGLQFQTGVISMSGTIELKVNTTSSPVNTTVTTAVGTTIINQADVTGVPNDPIPANIFKVYVNGNLRVGSVSFPFNFYVVYDSGSGQFQLWKTSPNTELVAVQSDGTILTPGLSLPSLLDFAQPGGFDLVSMLKQLGMWLDTFRSSTLFDTQIPFTGGKTLGDAFDWTQAFINSIYSKMVSVEVQSPGIGTNGQLATPLPGGTATFQVTLGTDSNPGSPVTVNVPGLPFFLVGSQLTDAQVQSFIAPLMSAFVTAGINTDTNVSNQNNRLVARENAAGGLVIALQDSEVSKGTKLTITSTAGAMAPLGFGAAAINQVATLTQRYPTDNSNSRYPSFFSALATALGLGPVNYDPARQVYTFSLNLNQSFTTQDLFGSSSIPFNWSADLGPIASASLSGALSFSATVGLTGTLGFDLTAQDVPRVLSTTQVPVPVNGRINTDAHFTIYLNDDPSNVSAHPVGGGALTLTASSTASDSSVDDLAAKFNALFGTITLSRTDYPWLPSPTMTLDQVLIAQKADTELAISAKPGMLGIVNRIAITSASNDSFATELGFGNQSNSTGTMFLSASNSNIKGLFLDNASLSGDLTITTPTTISGSLSLGFVKVATNGGVLGTYTINSDGTTSTSPLHVGLSLHDQTTNSSRFYLSDLMNGTSSVNILNMVVPSFTGSLLLQLNNISVSGLGFSLPLSSAQISLFIPDIKNVDFNPNPYDATSNKEGLFITYPSLGDLSDLSNLNFSSIVQALQGIAQSLSQLSGFGFLNQKLPIIDMSVNDLIGYAAKFADLINAVSNGGGQSLQDIVSSLQTQIDQLFHLSPNVLQIILDNDGLTPSSLVTGGGTVSAPATASINPNGDNNAFNVTASANGTILNNSFIHIVGSSDVNGTSANVSWDSRSKMLTIKINPGQTTTQSIVDAINNAHTADPTNFPWIAAKPGTDNSKPDDGSGTFTTLSLEFKLNYTAAYANTLPFHLDLAQLLSQVGGSNAGLQALLNGVSALVQADASGTLTVSAGAALTLDFGLDLSNAANIRPFFYDDTGVVLTARVVGTNLSLSLTVGSVAGIQIQNGSVTLDGDGDPSTTPKTQPTPDNGAQFSLTLRDTDGTGRHYFDSNFFSTDNINIQLAAGVSAVLPVFATIGGVLVPLGATTIDPTTGYPHNDLVINIPDLARFFGLSLASSNTAVVRFIGPNNDMSITAPSSVKDFSVVLQSGSTAANFDPGTNTLTLTIQDGVTTGTALQTAIQAISTPSSGWTVALLDNDPGNINNSTPAHNDGSGTITSDSIKLVAPDFSSLFSNLDFCTILASATGPLLKGLDTLLGKLEDGINSIVSNVDLPLIGKGLSGAADFIQNFRSGLLAELEKDVQDASGDGLTAVQNAIKKAFWNSLGPGGLNLLVDVATGNPLDISKGYDQLNVTLDCNTGLLVKLRLAKELDLVDTSGNPIAFNIGVPGFGLQGNINVKVALGFDLRFGFGVSPQDGFFFDTSNNPALKLYFKVTLPNTHFTGQLLFLQLDMADDTTTPSVFSGQFTVDFTDPNNDGKLTWAELTSGGTSIGDLFHPQLAADALVNLDLAASFGGNTAFPRVLAQFHLHWHFDVANGAGEPQISFNNIELDLGSFISNFLGPILSKIQSVTKPLQPIIDVATARIPILSDLAGHTITLLDLAQLFGLLEPSTVDFIKDVGQVITLINDIQGIGQGDILIPFGSFTLSGGSDGQMDQVAPTGPNSINLQQSILNDPDPGLSSQYQSAAAGFAGDLGSTKNFSIPIFDHPSQLFNLFIGKPVGLIEWRMPQFKFTFTYTQQIPIYPPLYAQFGGGIGATINIGFGYDTFGIQEFISDPKKNAVDLLDGFYVITNDTNGKPQPALTLTGEIFAGADISLVIVEVGVRGGVSATVNFYWNDNSDNDGKMRVSEIIANALEDPRCIFNIQGSISLFLEAYLKIDLFFFSIDKTWRFATITLVSFDLTCPEPVLGEMSGGTLTLNMGPLASQRQVDDTSDGNETFVVRHISGSASNETVQVTWAQHTQTFTGVSEVDANCGQGDNVLDLRGVLSTCNLTGGPGTNTIYLSDGPNSTCNGGSGPATIYASKATTATGVVIHGGDGNDVITAGTEAITIYGDGGSDTITGSTGNDPGVDHLYGGAGDDNITAGNRQTYIDGGDGNDTIHGGSGLEFILGGAGDDTIYCGASDNIVNGGDGNDVIYGGAGNDLLIGGNGDNTIYGNAGSDLIIGNNVATVAGKAVTEANWTALNAAVDNMASNGIGLTGVSGPTDTSSGNCFLVGGGGSDVIFGGGGNNIIYGGNFLTPGQTSVITEDGNNFITGGPGNDTIFGDDAMGKAEDRNTGIAIKSSVWADTNGNHIRDSSEKGLGGVNVWLYKQSTIINTALPVGTGALAMTTTDVDGSFQFVGLDPNGYKMVFSLPSSLNFTLVLNPGNVDISTTDSDAVDTVFAGSVHAGVTAPFTVGFNTTYKAVSAGYTGNPVISVSNASVAQSNSTETQMVFNVTLSGTAFSGTTAVPVEVDYFTADGNSVNPLLNATAGHGDYVPTVGSQDVIFKPGESSKQITILVNSSDTYKPNQQFRLEVSAKQLNPDGSTSPLNVNGSAGTVTALGTIFNTVPVPAISISDWNPRGATPQFVSDDFINFADFRQKLVSQVGPVSAYLWSQFSAADQQTLQSATASQTQQTQVLISELNTILAAPSIYTPSRFASITLSVQTSALLATSPIGDALVLLNRLLLQDAYPTDLAKTIAGATEGDTAMFVVTLSNPSENTVTVDWNTDTSLLSDAQPNPAVDAAIPSPLPHASFVMGQGTVTFQPGETTQVVTVQTLANNYHEGDSSFWVNLSNSTYASITDPRGWGVIPDKDPAPTVTLVPVVPRSPTDPFTTDVTKDPSSPVAVNFYIQVSAASGLPVTVTWATSPGTAVEGRGSQDPDVGDLPDYVGVPTSTSPAGDGQWVFAPGASLSKMITVWVNPTKPYTHPTDTKNFFVNLLSADNATIAATPANQTNHDTVVIHQAVATTDAGPWSVFFDSPSYDVTEPATGSIPFTFNVEHTPGSSQAVAVVTIANGTAINGVDYTAVYRQLVRFGPNELSKQITINILADGLADGNETVLLSLNNPTGGPVRAQPSSAVITIHEANTTAWIEGPLKGSTSLALSDIQNFNGLVFLLALHVDQVSLFLWNSFSASLQAEISAPDAALPANLTAALNTIIQGPSIYTPARFAAVVLSPVSQDWVAHPPTLGNDVQEFNRWLLTDAYSSVGLFTQPNPALQTSDFTDFNGLVSKLASHTDPVSNYLWGLFSVSLQNEIMTPDSALQGNLTTALNNILLGPSIYSQAVFGAVTLSSVTNDWLMRNPTVIENRLEMNRWLLANAYPDQIGLPVYGFAEGTSAIPNTFANHNFTVYLTAPAGPSGVAFSFQSVDLSARSAAGPDQDFQAVSGVVFIPAGTDHNTIAVPVQEDAVAEPNETFAVRLINSTGPTIDTNASAAVATIFDDDLTTITGTIFYDTNGNGYQDLNDPAMPGVKVDITYYLNGVAQPVETVTTDANGNYTAMVALGQVSLAIESNTVTSPIPGLGGAGSTYHVTTHNDTQSVNYQGIVGLPGFADIGYQINTTPTVNKSTAKDAGRGGTDNTIYGGPGSDTIQVGNGFNHIVGGYWYSATDSNIPINSSPTHSYDVTVHVQTSGLPIQYSNGAGPIWYIDPADLKLGGAISGQIWIGTPATLFMQDVVVTLMDCNGNQVDSQTAHNGTYSFTHLYDPSSGPASEYLVRFDLPSGYIFLAPGPNNDVQFGNLTHEVNISSGTPTATLNAGITPGGVALGGGQYKFQFTQPSYITSDTIANNVLTVTIQRGNSFQPAAIVFDTEAATAVAGVDYVAVFHTLIQFNVGESEKTVSISILQTNNLFNCAAPKYFNLVLRDPTGRPMASAPVFLTGPTVSDDDTITAGSGWNIVLGDSGIIPAPTIIANSSSLSNIIYTGGVGNDVIDAGTGPDFVNAGPGNDTIYADAGFNTIQGGAGNDTIYVGMDTESIDGGDGFNTIISNRDVPYINLTASGINATLTLGVDNTVPGILSTHNLKNIQMAELFGGPSNNTFDITNWVGSAFIVGNGGTDTLLLNTTQALKLKDATSAEANLYYSLYGFYKDATVSLASGGQYDLSALQNVFITLGGGAGGVTADASGYSRPVTFQDMQGNDTLIGGSANDTFLLNAGLSLGTETITGNGGTDSLDFSTSTVGVMADLSQVGVVQTVSPGLKLKLTDQLENITGSRFADTLTGDSLNNIINGGIGTDTLIAGTGNDTFPFDCDTPLGSKTIVTIGAPGFNTLDFSGTQTQPITIDLAVLGVPQVVNPNLTITVQGVGIRQVFGGTFMNTPGTFSNTIRGNSSGDTLHGGPFDDLLQGRSGNDILDGRGGHNMLIGGGGVDTVLAQGDTNFTLTNTLLTQSDGTTDSLDGITLAILTGGVHANTFNITGWSGTATITGVKDPTNPLDDTLIAGANADFTLSDTSLDSPSFFAPIALSGIDIAILTTGVGGHTLDASNFSGEVTLNGGDGNDTFILGGGLQSHAVVNGGLGTNALIENYTGVVPDINFTVQDTNLLAIINPTAVHPIQRMDAFTNIQSLTLTGGAAINTYDISGWHGANLTLNGSGIVNTLTAQQAVPGTVTLTDTSLVMPSSGSITLNNIRRAVITGTVGDDILDASGYSGVAILHGGAGNDTLIAGSGLDLLDGGPGNDRFVFRQFGALHTVFVQGGDGEDTLDFSGQIPSQAGANFTAAVAIDISFLNATQTVAPGLLALHLVGAGSGTTPDIEDIIGSAGGGVYVGNSLDNVFTITGGVNNMNGTGGSNTIVATADANMTLTNGSLAIGANNSLIANFQTARLTGGATLVHTIDASAFTGTTVLQAGPMGDTLIGGTGTNTFIDGPGNDILRGGSGNNTYVFNVDVPQGQDTITQAPGGINTLDFSAARSTGVTVNLAGGTQQVAPNLQLTLPANSIQDVIGTPQIDYLTGNTLNNSFTGNGGADVIVGGGSGSNAVLATGDNDYVLTDSSLTTLRSNAFLTAADITDVAAFIARLQNDANPNTAPVSQFLWSQFSPGIQAVLTNASLPLSQRKDTLVAALNQVLQGGSIYNVARFAGVSLSAQTNSLLGANPQGDVLVLLNRFLLSDTYPARVLANHDPLYSLLDIRDPVAFVARLQSDPNPNTAPISQFLWSQFSPATQTALTTGTPSQRAVALVNALNQLLLGNSLFDVTRFMNVLLSAQTTMLLGQNPTGANLIRLNRFLLVDTYRGDLAVSLTNIQFGVLTGGASNNIIDAGDFDHGGLGGVYLFGMDGNDTLIGGYGNDYLDGGNGNDKLYGGAGSNVLVGGAGDDLLNPTGYFNPAYGTAGISVLIGGTGNDTYSFDLSTLKPTAANPTPPNPTVYVLEQPGEGYNDTITGLGTAGISVNLTAATQYFYLNLLTNTVQSSTTAPVGLNYQMLLTLDMSAPAVSFYRNLLTNGLQFVSGPNTQLLLSLPPILPGGVENAP
ncbi:MAG TPA: Calx-beta domain-containing protein [Candidatus Acidoferrum sp.]|jgi:Ca2+-binding RTX toxin-like protein|nr:Calx-beta domain-containing protein [Candidatus Acidoferrum sp.]